jgi:hypothetical protein
VKRQYPTTVENADALFEQSFLFGDLHGDVLHYYNVECAIRKRQCQRTTLLELHLVLQSDQCRQRHCRLTDRLTQFDTPKPCAMLVRHAPRGTANACAHIQDVLPGLQRRHLRQRVGCCKPSHMKHVQPVEVVGSRLLDGDSSRPQCQHRAIDRERQTRPVGGDQFSLWS